MLALFLQINLLISRTFSSFLSKSDSKGLFTGEDDRCFDCHLSQYKCLNWGNCSDISGRCLCSTGFGLNDCSGVLCGSLARTERPARGKDEKKCNCDDGWTGINCNVCQRDDVCNQLNPTGENGTCYNSFIPVKSSHSECNITNGPILKILDGKIPQLTLECDKASQSCHFEFWVDQQESFFCKLNECSFALEPKGDMNVTTTTCSQVACKCYPERFLCEENATDLSEWFQSEEGPKGPGTFHCEEVIQPDGIKRRCYFSEPNMNGFIKDIFGGPNIQLSCPVAGECLHSSQVPGYNPGESTSSFPLWFIAVLSLGLFLLLGLLFFLVMFLKSRMESHEYTAIPSQDAYADEQQERQDLMSHHVPCTMMFRGINYTIETKTTAPSYLNSRVNVDLNPEIAPVLSPANGKLQQVVLEAIQGSIQPGEVMAIMGGSGAGKTTLLDILARKNKSGTVTGDILINGEYMDYEKYRSIIGYVDQEDTLMDTLTVYETILYSALLRLPRKMQYAAKKKRVQETMEELGIVGIANKRIGNSGKRGLSGGEKRRVSIACELVTSPSILFLDEPTSGLDSYNAYNVIECLIGLARNYHRSVIFTIHQPRSNIYALFDHLILLSKGRLVYSGHAQQPAIEHFAKLGYECPVGFNVADYLVDLTMHAAKSGDRGAIPTDPIERASTPSSLTQKKSIKEEQEALLYSPRSPSIQLDDQIYFQDNTAGPSSSSNNPNPMPRQESTDTPHEAITIIDGYLIKPFIAPELYGLIRGYDNCNLAKAIRADITSSLTASYPGSTSAELETIRMRSRSSYLSLNEIETGITMIRNYFTNLINPSYSRSSANFADQIRILSGRTFKNLYRNPELLLTHYAISIIAAFICGMLYWKVDNTLSGFQNRLGVMFFICALFGFGCLSSMHSFATERLIFLRERANRYYSPITYFLSKIVFDVIPLRVIPPVILGLIAYHMVGLQPELALLGRFLLVLVLFNVTSAACCLAISIICSDQGVASLLATLIMLFEMLFGGLLLNKATMPESLKWMQSLSFFNYAFEALVVNEVADLMLIEEKFGLKIKAPGALILHTFGLNPLGFWDDVRSLIIMCTVFFSIGFLWLQFMVKERR